MSKILGGQTKILGEQKVVKSDKCMGDSQLLVWYVPGLPPLSLRLCPYMTLFLTKNLYFTKQFLHLTFLKSLRTFPAHPLTLLLQILVEETDAWAVPHLKNWGDRHPSPPKSPPMLVIPSLQVYARVQGSSFARRPMSAPSTDSLTKSYTPKPVPSYFTRWRYSF